MFAFREGFVSSDGIPTIENEFERKNAIPLCRYYNHFSAAISDAVTTSISLTNVGDLGVRIGDYLMIDDEIVRVKGSIANPATNPLTVFRAVLEREQRLMHGTVVRRINHIQLN